MKNREEIDRRELIKMGVGALGVAAGALVIGCGGSAGLNLTTTATGSTGGGGGASGDAAYLNYLLNFEYLKAQYYLLGATGVGLPATALGPNPGKVNGGSQVSFSTQTIQGLMTNIAQDETLHVSTLQSLVGSGAISMPSIDFVAGFSALGNATGLGATFNAFASEENFLLGSFFFEDPVVTAQYGVLSLLTTATNVIDVAGIVGTDSYHAGAVRYTVYAYGADAISKAQQFSAFRASVGGGDDSPPVLSLSLPTIAPHDTSGFVYGRTTNSVDAIFYLAGSVSAGGFFPNGLNGSIVSSLRRRR